MSGDMFGWDSWGLGEGVAGIWWVEARDAADVLWYPESPAPQTHSDVVVTSRVPRLGNTDLD